MRIRTLDACLQRRQRRWTLEDLHQACCEALYDYEGISTLSLRTVQRDIELMRGDKLGYFAPIVVREKKYYEYEDPDFSITQLPLSKRDLEELGSAMDIINHYQGFQELSGQEDVLARMQDKLQFQTSRNQIIYIETNTRLAGLHFLSLLYDHIARKEPILIVYQSFKRSHPMRFRVSPYFLKEFNNRWFLIAHNPKLHDIQTLALDRIVSVCRDEKGRYVENTFFDPETYFDDMVGVTRALHSPKELVTLHVDANQAPYVLTKPLHGSQQLIERKEDGSILVTLQVILNMELERLILGYGFHVEVIAPRSLRDRVVRTLLAAVALYQQ